MHLQLPQQLHSLHNLNILVLLWVLMHEFDSTFDSPVVELLTVVLLTVVVPTVVPEVVVVVPLSTVLPLVVLLQMVL